MLGRPAFDDWLVGFIKFVPSRAAGTTPQGGADSKGDAPRVFQAGGWSGTLCF